MKDIRTKILQPNKEVPNSVDQKKSEDSVVGESLTACLGNINDDGRLKIPLAV